MLARYHIERGKALSDMPRAVREGHREDTRKHTRHCLRPSAELVASVDAESSASEWAAFARDYRALLEERFSSDRRPFDELYERAKGANVFIGCSCPSAKNPDVRRCHTVLALKFMQARYRDLRVELP
jgi:uncharacterized protein YeaO (DUF488 family)